MSNENCSIKENRKRKYQKGPLTRLRKKSFREIKESSASSDDTNFKLTLRNFSYLKKTNSESDIIKTKIPKNLSSTGLETKKNKVSTSGLPKQTRKRIYSITSSSSTIDFNKSEDKLQEEDDGNLSDTESFVKSDNNNPIDDSPKGVTSSDKTQNDVDSCSIDYLTLKETANNNNDFQKETDILFKKHENFAFIQEKPTTLDYVRKLSMLNTPNYHSENENDQNNYNVVDILEDIVIDLKTGNISEALGNTPEDKVLEKKINYRTTQNKKENKNEWNKNKGNKEHNFIDERDDLEEFFNDESFEPGRQPRFRKVGENIKVAKNILTAKGTSDESNTTNSTENITMDKYISRMDKMPKKATSKTFQATTNFSHLNFNNNNEHFLTYLREVDESFQKIKEGLNMRSRAKKKFKEALKGI